MKTLCDALDAFFRSIGAAGKWTVASRRGAGG
jgi:hypothetical protein